VGIILNNPFGRLNARLLIEDSVLGRVNEFRQIASSDPEAGGILLGFRREAHLHVASATPPGPQDRRSRYHFRRDVAFHSQIALLEWTKSQETMDYLGEWHTHPERDPRPSKLDLREWRQICGCHKEPMVFLIQGISRRWVGVGLGQYIESSPST
jgi:integrative and conjugative element protein (TIGR02256 family)